VQESQSGEVGGGVTASVIAVYVPDMPDRSAK